MNPGTTGPAKPAGPMATANAGTSPPRATGAVRVDLASRWLGGSVMVASDESFGFKENLLVPTPADFVPGRYDHRGEIVDGWETRRRRGEPGHDWAIIRLGAPGVITEVDVDTSFFTGNYPPTCQIEACGMEGHPGADELTGADAGWIEIVPRSALKGDGHNLFAVSDPRRFTHVRLSIHPDGGVARLRVHGEVVPDPRHWDGVTVDLATQDQGGLVVGSSNGFYTSAELLNRPDRARTMGEGWETSRRRDSGHDVAVIRLAATGRLRQIEIDTSHFKYNASAEVELYGSAPDVPGSHDFPGSPDDAESPSGAGSPRWSPLLPRTRLQPDTRHLFTLREPSAAVAAVRIDAFPDGGISRIRLVGTVEPSARRDAGLRWFNALPADQAAHCLAEAGVSEPGIARLLAARPLAGNLSAVLPPGSAGEILGSWIVGR
ncbi:allantoicase [Streptosporangium subroseum]|uniref:allantoicase n=1 Tax=Streptosporangium subroseum TaxID=106412 RepID=UPI00308AEDB4|nr:allantoicase [Streptosporangium subroseum]